MQLSDRGERFFSGLKNRFLQAVARHAPGARSFRVWLNRWRGVEIGQNVWIGYDAIFETSRPDLVTVGDRATVQIRATVIAHFPEQLGVVVEEDATVGPGAIILPNVTIGQAAIVTAGSRIARTNYKHRVSGTTLQLKMYSRYIEVPIPAEVETVEVRRPWQRQEQAGESLQMRINKASWIQTDGGKIPFPQQNGEARVLEIRGVAPGSVDYREIESQPLRP
jgi:acetyltransferase-like isoleucine patch superfamily enzyme